MIDLVFRNSTQHRKFSMGFFVKLFEIAAEELNLTDYTIELSLSIVDREQIKGLNLRHRGKDKPTDVLSFPLDESRFNKYGIMPLGDIFICFDVAKKSDAAPLAVHGFLHLIGYDHEESEKKSREMEDLEKKILNKFSNAAAHPIRH